MPDKIPTLAELESGNTKSNAVPSLAELEGKTTKPQPDTFANARNMSFVDPRTKNQEVHLPTSVQNFVTTYQKDPKAAMSLLPSVSDTDIDSLPLNSMVKDSLKKAKTGLLTAEQYKEPVIAGGFMNGVEVKAKKIPTLSFGNTVPEEQPKKVQVPFVDKSQEQTVTPTNLPKNDLLQANLSLINSYLDKGDPESDKHALELTQQQASKNPYLIPYAARLDAFQKLKNNDFKGAALSYDKIPEDAKTVNDYNKAAYTKAKAGDITGSNADIDKAIERGNPSSLNDINDLAYTWQLKGHQAYLAGDTNLMNHADDQINQLKYASDRATKDNVFSMFVPKPLTPEEWKDGMDMLRSNFISAPILGAAENIGLAINGIGEMSTEVPKDKVYTAEEYQKAQSDRVMLGFAKALNGTTNAMFVTNPAMFLTMMEFGAANQTLEKVTGTGQYAPQSDNGQPPEQNIIGKVQEWVFNPLTEPLKTSGIWDKMSETEKNLAGALNVASTIFVLHSVGKVINETRGIVESSLEQNLLDSDMKKYYGTEKAKAEGALSENIPHEIQKKYYTAALNNSKGKITTNLAALSAMRNGENVTKEQIDGVVGSLNEAVNDPNFDINILKKQLPVSEKPKTIQDNINDLKAQQAEVLKNTDNKSIIQASNIEEQIDKLQDEVKTKHEQQTAGITQQINDINNQISGLYEGKENLTGIDLQQLSEQEEALNNQKSDLLKQRQQVKNNILNSTPVKSLYDIATESDKIQNLQDKQAYFEKNLPVGAAIISNDGMVYEKGEDGKVSSSHFSIKPKIEITPETTLKTIESDNAGEVSNNIENLQQKLSNEATGQNNEFVQHRQNIVDKFTQQFKDKGIPDEHISGAVALMDARAKSWASEEKGRTPEQWYQNIADVKGGEFEQGTSKLYQIIGEQGAKFKQDLVDNLDIARNMESQGKDSKEIFAATGWEKGVDGKWKVELDDKNSNILNGTDEIIKENKAKGKDYKNDGNILKLTDVLDNKELYESYPFLKDVNVLIHDMGTDVDSGITKDGDIGFNSNKPLNKTEIKPILLHEIQHLIQRNEGFARGTNKDVSFREAYRILFPKRTRTLLLSVDEITQTLTGKEKEKVLKKAGEIYTKSAGETEARNVENRSINEVDKTKPFSSTEDVAKDEQNVLFQKQGSQVKGAVETLADGKKVIHALNAPDVSTMVHEIGHVFEGDLTDAEKKTVTDFGGSEKFARGFEKYLRDGKAPTPELKTLFDKFKDWMTNIYQTLKGGPIEGKITPEIKNIFDRLLTEKESKETVAGQIENPLVENTKEVKPIVGGTPSETATNYQEYEPANAEKARAFAIDAAKNSVETKERGLQAGLDIGMSATEKNKAVNDINKGNYDTAPAKKLISKLSDVYQNGQVPFIEGKGGTSHRFGDTIKKFMDSIQDTKAENERIAQELSYKQTISAEDMNIHEFKAVNETLKNHITNGNTDAETVKSFNRRSADEVSELKPIEQSVEQQATVAESKANTTSVLTDGEKSNSIEEIDKGINKANQAIKDAAAKAKETKDNSAKVKEAKTSEDKQNENLTDEQLKAKAVKELVAQRKAEAKEKGELKKNPCPNVPLGSLISKGMEGAEADDFLNILKTL